MYRDLGVFDLRLLCLGLLDLRLDELFPGDLEWDLFLIGDRDRLLFGDLDCDLDLLIGDRDRLFGDLDRDFDLLFFGDLDRDLDHLLRELESLRATGDFERDFLLSATGDFDLLRSWLRERERLGDMLFLFFFLEDTSGESSKRYFSRVEGDGERDLVLDESLTENDLPLGSTASFINFSLYLSTLSVISSRL